MDKLDRRLLYSAFIFMVIIILQKQAQVLPYAVQLLLLAEVGLFLVLVILYCLLGISKKGLRLRMFDYVFYIYALLAAVSVIAYSASANIFEVVLLSLYYPAAYFVLYIFVFFIMTIGTYFVVVKKNYKIGFLLFALVFLIIVFYFTSKYIAQTSNDEELVTLYAARDIFNGTNPYTMNISRVIYGSQVANSTGFTLTTNSSIVGTIVWPSLFFLSFIPFYPLSGNTIKDFVGVDLNAQAAVFVFILIMVIWYIMDKKDILKSRYLLFGALIFFMSNLLSVTAFLMLALLLLAYAKLGSKYSWIFLGLALSIQEELWIPVLLLIAYSFNTYGLRKGVRDLLGSAGVFLLLNGYFILANPALYVHNVLLINNALVPSADAAVGFFLLTNYTIALSAYFQLFAFVTIAVFLISLYFNNKKAILALGFVPLLFMSHSMLSYYYFFVAALVIIMYSKPEKMHAGILRTYIKENLSYGYAFMAALGVICVAALWSVIAAHANYVNTVNFSISNQHAYFSNKTIYYNATLTYNSAAPVDNSTYILMNVYSFPNLEFYGIDNSSLLSGTTQCAFPCSININVLHLGPFGHSYAINLVARNISYQPYESVLIYKGAYAYNSGAVKVERGS